VMVTGIGCALTRKPRNKRRERQINFIIDLLITRYKAKRQHTKLLVKTINPSRYSPRGVYSFT